MKYIGVDQIERRAKRDAKMYPYIMLLMLISFAGAIGTGIGMIWVGR